MLNNVKGLARVQHSLYDNVQNRTPLKRNNFNVEASLFPGVRQRPGAILEKL